MKREKDETASEVLIGARLRAARQSRGMTLDAVASAAGITAGFVSKLERDQVSPSVASLVAICRAVGLRMGELFEPPPSHVVRAGEGTRINFGGQGAIEQVVTPGDQTLIEVIHSLIGPGGSGGDDLYVLEAEVEVVHVIRGHLVVTLGQERHELTAGDTMTFRGSDPHTWANESSEDCEVIWMLTPAP
ncbi:MAG: cupin domain-containing protein [Rhodoglobus sp.]